jgi:hypothetical protein
MICARIGIFFSSAARDVMCAVLVCAQKGASALNSFGYAGFRRIEARAFRVHSELSSKSRIVIRSITSSFSLRPILRALHGTISAIITPIVLTMDFRERHAATETALDKESRWSDWRHNLVWEVSTIAIPGQRLFERCEWIFSDLQPCSLLKFSVVPRSTHVIFLSGRAAPPVAALAT